MINTDVLRSVRYMLDLSDTHVANLVQYADPAVVLERDAVQAYLLREDEPGFVPLDDRLLGLFLAGLVFLAVYAATRNLFVAVAVHALGNAPTLAFEPQGAPTLWLLGGTLALVAAAAWTRRRRPPDAASSPSSLVASRAHP